MSTIALLGNPNTGKTSLFNILTDSYEYVGNWSGVTVEKKVGSIKKQNSQLVDLPGVYDFTPLSSDEAVVTNFLLTGEFNSMLNIVDASQFERSMHLTIQALEYGKPLVIGLNMIDVAEKRGLTFNLEKLSKSLHIPVSAIIARNGKGINELLSTLKQDLKAPLFQLNYGETAEQAIHMIQTKADVSRWIAIQFLAENSVIESTLKGKTSYSELLELRKAAAQKLNKPLSEHFFDVRTAFIERISSECIVKGSEMPLTFTDRIDRIVTHKWLGLPIFLGLMYLIFNITFTWIGIPLSDKLDGFFGGTLSKGADSLLNAAGAAPFIHDLIVDGIIAGVGGVLVFVPQIFVLFFFISLLEDSGYMARIAVVMDRIMEFFGLNGKAFIPMIISFGCNVPGIMAARTIEQRKERLMTILVNPFMSCSARLPVYALFVGAFFVQNGAAVVFSMYLLGIILALVVTKILSVTLLKDEQSTFIVELPPYRVPQAKTLWRSTWEKGRNFVRKAGTVILAGSVFIWLSSYAGPGGFGVAMENSFMAIIGSAIAPLFIPLGFATWQAVASLITGFLAKEVVVSTMSIIYKVQEGQLGDTMKTFFTPLTAYTFMVFVLLYVPCLATVAVIRRETGSLKWTAFAVAYPLVVAYLVALLVHTVGKILGFS
ncbi:ferrous iron transport protein B [Priestia megaterium]|uniref:ferrous iron transport protein B n=1 Tax=Priestia megaterium TaxID=1404 RepID=UPI0028779BAB|nr:ferrous iron transport protein B [Priestia megaterium]MBX4161002.1 ferrous iron transport protein B [Priestia megaterium]